MWISVWLMSLLCVFSGYAQNEGNESSDKEQSDNRYNRREQWYVQLQGGANYFFAENNRFESFGKGISYSYAFSVGKNFTPVWGARLQLSGGGDQGMHDAWEGSPKYDFQHIGGIAAVTFNLTNCIRGVKPGEETSPWNVLLMLGPGVMHTFDFNHVQESYTGLDVEGRNHFLLYGGAEVSYQFNKHWNLNLEVSADMVRDKYNGVECEKDMEGHGHLLLGVRYTFGKD